jgi:hypothetical protein
MGLFLLFRNLCIVGLADIYQFLINVHQLPRGQKPNLPKRHRTPIREVRLEAIRKWIMQTGTGCGVQVIKALALLFCTVKTEGSLPISNIL